MNVICSATNAPAVYFELVELLPGLLTPICGLCVEEGILDQ